MARKNAAAVALGKRRMQLLSPEERAALGRLGGQAKVPKGTAALSAEQRQERGRQGAAKRWGKRGRPKTKAA